MISSNKNSPIEQKNNDEPTEADNVFELIGVLFLENSARWAEFVVQRVNADTLTIQAPAIERFGIKYFGTVGDIAVYLSENFSLPYTTKRAAK